MAAEIFLHRQSSPTHWGPLCQLARGGKEKLRRERKGEKRKERERKKRKRESEKKHTAIYSYSVALSV